MDKKSYQKPEARIDSGLDDRNSSLENDLDTFIRTVGDQEGIKYEDLKSLQRESKKGRETDPSSGVITIRGTLEGKPIQLTQIYSGESKTHEFNGILDGDVMEATEAQKIFNNFSRALDRIAMIDNPDVRKGQLKHRLDSAALKYGFKKDLEKKSE